MNLSQNRIHTLFTIQRMKSYIFTYWDNSSHSLRHIPCKLNLMVIYMLIELMLTWHNNGSLANLQRHDEAGRTP